MLFDMGLTLRDGDREYYYAALDKNFPGMKERYIRTYGYAYELPSPNRDRLMKSSGKLVRRMIFCIGRRTVLLICGNSRRNISR